MAVAKTNRKWFLLLATASTTFFLVIMCTKPDYYEPNYETHSILFVDEPWKKRPENWRRLTESEIQKLSVLGRILYLDEPPPAIRDPHKQYEILVWKYGPYIENRHLKHFGKKLVDPFAKCSVKNCRITYKNEALETADIVIFHLHRMQFGELPKPKRSPRQIWAFLTDESPYNTFFRKNKLNNYNKVFNWSMTYRMDSDIPVPYGRAVLRQAPERNLTITKRRDVLVAILCSNCHSRNRRWDYVEQLRNHIAVDVYGGCGTFKTCPGHFKSDCRAIDDYLFYLSFENSNCDEYVTEKLWWNAYAKNSIPIVMGASEDSYRKLLPPNSYLNVDDYAHPHDLASHIKYLNATEKYREYYAWKRDFRVVNEHGYFQSESYHYCRVCEALNYNDRSVKVYEDLERFWSVKRDCHPSWMT